MPKLSIIVPTYNERENVAALYQAIGQALTNNFEIIFVDDNSPDATSQAIKELQAGDSRIKLLERPAKLGLGSAVMDGLKLAQGEYVCMMDADLSHDPQVLPSMLEAFASADIVVGSRHIPGGKIVGWPWTRHLASRLAILFSRWLLHPPVRDTTSGYALYRRQLLESLRGKLSAQGYKLLLEVVMKAPQARVQEVPITFVNRVKGKSKLNLREAVGYIQLCWELRRYAWGRRPQQ